MSDFPDVDARTYHNRWKEFKAGAAAEMIKQTKISFTGGLGPAMETLSKKWGTNDGQKAADKVKKVVADYRKLLAKVTTPGETKYAVPGLRPDQAWAGPKKIAEGILKDMIDLANKHKVGVPPKKK